MTTRRDLLKIASAIGITGASVSPAERVAALQALSDTGPERVVLNPIRFADEMYKSTPSTGGDVVFQDDWYRSICPEEEADYRRAMERLETYFRGAGIDAFHVFDDYTAAFNNLAEAMYQTGIQHGAAFENLRRVLVGDVVTCRTCRSTGLTKVGTTCHSCGGTGTVALKDGGR